MADMQKVKPVKGMKATVRKVSAGARILDVVFTVVFAYLAFTSETLLWQVLFGLSAVFCAYTAITAPLEKLPSVIGRALSLRKS
jgi:hypothetical protein